MNPDPDHSQNFYNSLPHSWPIFSSEILDLIARQLPIDDLRRLKDINPVFENAYLDIVHSVTLLSSSTLMSLYTPKTSMWRYWVCNREEIVIPRFAARVKTAAIDISMIERPMVLNYEGVNHILDLLHCLSKLPNVRSLNLQGEGKNYTLIRSSLWAAVPCLSALTIASPLHVVTSLLGAKQDFKLLELRLVVESPSPDDLTLSSPSTQLISILPFVNCNETLVQLELIVHDPRAHLSSFFLGLDYLPHLLDLSLYVRHDDPSICDPLALNSFLAKHAQQLKILALRFYGINPNPEDINAMMAEKAWFERCFGGCVFPILEDLAIGLGVSDTCYATILSSFAGSIQSLTSLTVMDVFLDPDHLKLVLSCFPENKIKNISLQFWWPDPALVDVLLEHCSNMTKLTATINSTSRISKQLYLMFTDELHEQWGCSQITTFKYTELYPKLFSRYPRFQWGLEDAWSIVMTSTVLLVNAPTCMVVLSLSHQPMKCTSSYISEQKTSSFKPASQFDHQPTSAQTKDKNIQLSLNLTDPPPDYESPVFVPNLIIPKRCSAAGKGEDPNSDDDDDDPEFVTYVPEDGEALVKSKRIIISRHGDKQLYAAVDIYFVETNWTHKSSWRNSLRTTCSYRFRDSHSPVTLLDGKTTGNSLIDGTSDGCSRTFPSPLMANQNPSSRTGSRQ
ncbi:hypothetical protein AMATHDRAFT_50691 [Amanita thiersii Skay4041]|uniref:Uncharacterized protein n=1 Tax=Amanita thiersii Skay4041 TaxID=703135 RepID=A0A2A9N9Y5_9AGAR|nr:hypothetical protein AMATHDRAFT_50691 [Amanita thiersii Skay4041]